MDLTTSRKPASLGLQIGALTISRTILNAGYRMVYPFLPAIARGLGVPVEMVTGAITARAGLGLVGPVLGSMGDVRGRRAAVLTGLGLFGGGMLLVTLWPTYPALFIALLMNGAGKIIYDAAMQAHVGDQVPYARRGLALAITELSWSIAFFVGMPIVGWLIARSGWTAPFPWLAVVGLGGAVLLWRLIPPDGVKDGASGAMMAGLRVIISRPAARAGLAVGLLITMANELISIVYGVWMEDAFGLQVAALGAASAVIGVAELSGEGLVAWLVDRVGKTRSVIIGVLANSLSAVLLIVLGNSLMGALVGLFLFYISFEFTLVSSIPLVSELVPASRATMMAAYGSAASAGRMLGALVGPFLFRLGLGVNGGGAVALNLVAVLLLVLIINKQNL